MEYKIFKSPAKAIKMLLLSAVFVALGVLLLTLPDTPAFIAWACIVFFGLGIPIGLFQLFDRRPQIVLNELGVFDRTAHSNLINWDIIEDAYLTEMHKQQFICLVLRPEFEPSLSETGITGAMRNMSKALGFQELNINLSGVKVDAEKLLGLVLAMRSADRATRTETLQKQIAG